MIFSAGLVQIVCCHIDRGLGALVQAAPGKDHVVVIGRAFQVGNVYRANEGHAILFPQDRLRHLESHKPADGGRKVGDGQLPVVKMAVNFLVRGDPGRPFPLGLPTVIVPVFRTAMIRRDDHQPLLVEPLFPIFDRLPDLGDLLVGFQGIIVEETAVTLNVAGVVGIPQIDPTQVWRVFSDTLGGILGYLFINIENMQVLSFLGNRLVSRSYPSRT